MWGLVLHCRQRSTQTNLVEVEIPNGTSSRSVFGLLESLFEFAVKQLRFDLLFVSALTEQGLTALRLLFKKTRRVVQIGTSILFRWRLMEKYFAELRIHRQRGATARANHFDLSHLPLPLGHGD